MPTGLDKNDTKEAVKEALKEWLDEKLREFGWLSIKSIGAAALTGLAYLILTMEGWHK